MHTITEIEKTIYLNKPDYDHMMRYPEIVRGGYHKKTRGINVKGVMKNTKCYHVVLDEEYLSWQLSMYELAYGKKFDKLYAIWLPKGGIAKLVEIKRKNKKEIEKIILE